MPLGLSSAPPKTLGACSSSNFWAPDQAPLRFPYKGHLTLLYFLGAGSSTLIPLAPCTRLVFVVAKYDSLYRRVVASFRRRYDFINSAVFGLCPTDLLHSCFDAIKAALIAWWAATVYSCFSSIEVGHDRFGVVAWCATIVHSCFSSVVVIFIYRIVHSCFSGVRSCGPWSSFLRRSCGPYVSALSNQLSSSCATSKTSWVSTFVCSPYREDLFACESRRLQRAFVCGHWACSLASRDCLRWSASITATNSFCWMLKPSEPSKLCVL